MHVFRLRSVAIPTEFEEFSFTIRDFLQLHHLPLPIPSEDGHCLSFAEVFCEKITGEHRPSLLKKPSKSNSLPFYASVQHVKNCQMVIQCENCDLWRIIFSKYKLKPSQKQQLQQLLDNVSYIPVAQN